MPPRIAAQMLFETDDEFIWVTENEKEAYASRSYGGTSYYVFLKDINDVTLKYKHGDVIVISVRIQGGQELTLKLPAFRENEARQIVERLK